MDGRGYRLVKLTKAVFENQSESFKSKQRNKEKMHFTLVFHSHESQDLSYSLVFIPCPAWLKGEKELINLNPEKPNYAIGSLKKLINLEGIDKKLAGGKECAIIVHPEGNGTDEDLNVLKKDLEQERFKTKVLQF